MLPNPSRIRLSAITDQDTPDILRWRNSESVMRQFLIRTPLTRETHEAWLRDKVGKGLVYQFVILDEQGKGIGSVYLRDVDTVSRKAEMGIFIGESSATGKGYGLEATLAIVQYGFDQLGLHKIYLRVLANNLRAINVYHRAGFAIEGTAKDDVLIDGQYQSVVWMARFEEEKTR